MDFSFLNNSFCEIGVQKVPIDWERAPYHMRETYLDMYHEYRNVTKGAGSLHQTKINVDAAVNFINSVNPSSCRNFHPQDLVLHGDVSYGARDFFENEAKMALRLANFISAFLQISDPNEVYSGKRVADRPLTEDQMIGETLALIMGNTRIWAAGVYWERNKFTNRTLFAPFAYKQELNVRKFKVEDLARLNKTREVYTEKPWYRFLKQRWSTNFDALQKHYMKIKIRHNETGEFNMKYEHYPNFYRAGELNSGYWTTPSFDCHGYVKKWLITYAAPFFGWDSLKVNLEFKYVLLGSINSGHFSHCRSLELILILYSC